MSLTFKDETERKLHIALLQRLVQDFDGINNLLSVARQTLACLDSEAEWRDDSICMATDRAAEAQKWIRSTLDYIGHAERETRSVPVPVEVVPPAPLEQPLMADFYEQERIRKEKRERQRFR